MPCGDLNEKEIQNRGNIRICLADHFAVEQNLTQRYKTTILQIKKKKKVFLKVCLKVSFPPPGDPPNPGIKLISPTSPALEGGFFTPKPSGKPSEEATEF